MPAVHARSRLSLLTLGLALQLAGCATTDDSPTASSTPALSALPTEARVQGLTIQLPSEFAADTVVTLGGALQLTVAATDAAGRAVTGVTVAWASGDTSVATVAHDGALMVHRSGLVQLAATVGAVSRVRSFPVILIDGAAVSDVLDDPLVARLMTGLSPTVRGRVQSAMAASAGALAAGAGPMLRTTGANVSETLRNAEDPADRTVLALLELYVHKLELALTIHSEN